MAPFSCIRYFGHTLLNLFCMIPLTKDQEKEVNICKKRGQIFAERLLSVNFLRLSTTGQSINYKQTEERSFLLL